MAPKGQLIIILQVDFSQMLKQKWNIAANFYSWKNILFCKEFCYNVRSLNKLCKQYNLEGYFDKNKLVITKDGTVILTCKERDALYYLSNETKKSENGFYVCANYPERYHEDSDIENDDANETNSDLSNQSEQIQLKESYEQILLDPDGQQQTEQVLLTSSCDHIVDNLCTGRIIKLIYCPTKDMIADVLSKLLPKEQFKILCLKLGVGLLMKLSHEPSRGRLLE